MVAMLSCFGQRVTPLATARGGCRRLYFHLQATGRLYQYHRYPFLEYVLSVGRGRTIKTEIWCDEPAPPARRAGWSLDSALGQRSKDQTDLEQSIRSRRITDEAVAPSQRASKSAGVGIAQSQCVGFDVGNRRVVCSDMALLFPQFSRNSA